MSDMGPQCQHIEIKERFCMRCGIYYEKRLYSHDIIDNLRLNEFDLSKNKDYSSLNENILNTFTQINFICRDFEMGFSTKILACYIFWHSLKDTKIFTKKDVYLSILIAFNYQESKLQTTRNREIKQHIISVIHEGRQTFQKELIYQEMEILQKINFKLRLVTFVDFLQFYVVSGVMFSNERKRTSDYEQIINFIDSEIQRFMQKGLFFSEPNQQYLALKILYNARQKCLGIDQIWNWHIENITKTKKQLIDELVSERKVLSRLRQQSLNSVTHSPLLKAKNHQLGNHLRSKSIASGIKASFVQRRFKRSPQRNENKVSRFQLFMEQKSKLKNDGQKITRA